MNRCQRSTVACLLVVGGASLSAQSPITDPEQINAAARLEALYQHEGYLPRSARETFVDEHGRVQWSGEYRQLRNAGLDHETAIQQIEATSREIWHRARAAEGAIDPPPPLPGDAFPAWSGRLSIAPGQRGFVDRLGAWQFPLCAHFGEAFSALAHGRGPEVEAQLRAFKAAGYDCSRGWLHLGYYQVAWRGKEATPFSFIADNGRRIEPTPGYYEHVREYLRMHRRVGLAIHLSQGDLNTVPEEAVRVHYARLAAIITEEQAWDLIALVEAINEDHMNGHFGSSILRAWVEPFRRVGALIASSCPVGCTEEPAAVLAYTRDFSVRYFHGHRTGDATDRLRHKFSLGYEWSPTHGTPRLMWEGEWAGPNEFPGPGVTIGHTEDVEELGLLHTMALMVGSATTFTSQRGIFWEGPIDQHKGFHVVPKMRAILRAFAADVMTWTRKVHGGRSDAVWCVPAGCRSGGYYGDPGVTSGPARINQVIAPDGRRAVVLVDGGRGTAHVRNFMRCDARVTVVWPKDDESVQVDTFTIPAGGDLGLDYRVGRLLLAECTATPSRGRTRG